MRRFKNFKGSDARCPSIHFLFYANTTKYDIGANLICRSKCKCTQHFNQGCRRKEGRERWGGGAEPLLNLRRGPVPHPLLINDRFFSGSLTIFPLASFINGKNLKAIQACILTFQRVIANIERNNLFNGY